MVARHRPRVAVPLAAVLLIAAACGDDDKSSDPSASESADNGEVWRIGVATLPPHDCDARRGGS
ncbi:MAG: hypothetical protein AAGF73_11710 [Actinomycetota bacterium]